MQTSPHIRFTPGLINGKCTVSPNIPPLSEFQVFNTLDTLHHTAEGIDKLPAWFLQLGTLIFSKVLTFLFSN